MMQFFQKRDFGALISDTFTFFKYYGKNYFKSYFLINGLLLILFIVLFIIGFGNLFQQIVGSNIEGNRYYFEEYFQANEMPLILTFIGFLIVFSAFALVAYSFPVLYLKRVTGTESGTVTTDEILSDLKKNAGKLLVLFFGLVFIITPLFLIVFSVSYLLILVLVGIFAMLFVIPASYNIVNFLVYDYLNTDRTFFQSLGYAFRAQFSYRQYGQGTPFWKYWGSAVVMYLIQNVVMSLFTIVPMVILFSMAITVPQNGDIGQNPFQGTFGVVLFSIYGISILISFVMMNLMEVNAGLMYYDSRTDIHRKIDMDEIDSIGNHEAI